MPPSEFSCLKSGRIAGMVAGMVEGSLQFVDHRLTHPINHRLALALVNDITPNDVPVGGIPRTSIRGIFDNMTVSVSS